MSKIKQELSNVTGKILIASPYTMEGNVFYKSLIYVVNHSTQGSIGLIFNHPVQNVPVSNIFQKMDSNIDINKLKMNIYLGGPVEVERGFFLHSAEYNKNVLYSKKSDNIAISSSVDILQDIANGTGPKETIFIVGYTGWNPGQMEAEINDNLWIVANPDRKLIFDEHIKDKWQFALNSLGIEASHFVPTPGHC